MVIFLEGPDRVGKTHIAKALAKKYGLVYWKNNDNAEYENPEPNAFAHTLKYHYYKLPEMCRLFESVGSGVVFDRNFISEWVYSAVFNRQTHWELIYQLENIYNEMGGIVIYCTKEYSDKFDDEHVSENDIERIKEAYLHYFNNHRKMKTLWLDTTDEDIDKQLESIDSAIGGKK